MVKKTQPSYYMNIPAFVWDDKDLLEKPKAILLYGHIVTLTNKSGECWATNKYFMEHLGIKSATTITDYLNLLVNKGFIKKKKIYKEGTKQIEKRVISINVGLPVTPDCNTPMSVDCNTPMSVDCKENNTSNNNTSINNNKRNIKESQASLTDRFEKLWKQYPKKQGKKVAFAAYKRAIKKGVQDKDIELGIANYNKYIKITKKDYQYIKQGSTWFNQSCWDDEYNYGNQPKQNTLPNGWADYYESNGGTETW